MSVLATLRTPVTAVWAVLVAATTVSLWVGTDHGIEDRDAAAVALVVIAFVKVDLVGSHFMELRHAAPLLRRLFHGYVLVLCSVLVALLLVG